MLGFYVHLDRSQHNTRREERRGKITEKVSSQQRYSELALVVQEAEKLPQQILLLLSESAGDTKHLLNNS